MWATSKSDAAVRQCCVDSISESLYWIGIAQPANGTILPVWSFWGCVRGYQLSVRCVVARKRRGEQTRKAYHSALDGIARLPPSLSPRHARPLTAVLHVKIIEPRLLEVGVVGVAADLRLQLRAERGLLRARRRLPQHRRQQLRELATHGEVWSG